MNDEATIPCIKKKCLLYPVCRYKETIICADLKHYISCNTLNHNFKMKFKHLARVTRTEKELGVVFISGLEELQYKKRCEGF